MGRHNKGHQDEHQSGGEDEIAQGSLLPQDPTSHASDHIDGGSDEITSALDHRAYPQNYGTSRPSYGTDGRTFYDTDDYVVWLDKGSSWQKMAASRHNKLDVIGEDDHHTAFTPTDHDGRDHSAISDTVRLDEWAVPTNALDINNQELDNVSSLNLDNGYISSDSWGGLKLNFGDVDKITTRNEDLEQYMHIFHENGDFEALGTVESDDGFLSHSNLNMDNNNINDVASIDGGGDAVQFDDILDLNNNDLEDDTVTIWDTSNQYIPQGILENDTVTVADNDVSLGGSTDIDGADLIGSEGSSGQVLQTDGSVASWSSYPEFVAYEPGITEWGDGLDDEEVHRMNLQSGETFELYRIELRLKGGGTDSDVSLDVYDNDDDNVIDSVTAGNTSTSSGTSGSGNLIQFRISNSTGEAVNAVPIVRGRIE